MGLDKKMEFIIYKPMEFLYSLIAVSLKNMGIEEGDIAPSRQLIEQVDVMRKKLSKFAQGELGYFFDKDVNIVDGFGQIIIWRHILDNPGICDVPDLIDSIENSSEPELFSYILGYMIRENKHRNASELYNLDELKHNLAFMLEVVRDMNFSNPSRKEKLIECMENPHETKQRLCFLLRQFYEKCFKPIEEEIVRTLILPLKMYEELFNNDPQKFCRQYLFKDYEVFSQEVNIHVSYFKYVRSDYYFAPKKPEWIIIGYKMDEYYGETSKREKIYKFLKAVSDKKRMDIIDLLLKKSWYVNEIADELNMTSATASYHLTTLQELDIVGFERSEHRFYYYLNREVLSKLFDEAKELLIHD